MIAKQIKGKDFYGVLAYNQKKVDKGVASILDANINLKSVVIQTKEFNVVRQLRPNVSKAVYHVSLNLPYTDKLNDRQFSELGKQYLNEMGFEDNQYIIYKHTDQEHAHIHIVANRICFSGKVVSDSHDYKRSEQVVRKLEKQFNLSLLQKHDYSNVLSVGEIEKSLRTGEVPDRIELQLLIIGILQESENIKDFITKLLKKKITPKFNMGKSGTVTGISFSYKDKHYKGSKVKRSLSWHNLKTHLHYEQIRDHSIIHKFNSRITNAEANLTRPVGKTLEDIKVPSHKSEKNIEQPRHHLERAKKPKKKGLTR